MLNTYVSHYGLSTYTLPLKMNMTNPVLQLFICGVVQLLLAVPFLYTSPLNYLLGAFNLGRVFLFQWTVNFRYTDR